MGTLRFFEEVVSFKIRRTFGFADYIFGGRVWASDFFRTEPSGAGSFLLATSPVPISETRKFYLHLLEKTGGTVILAEEPARFRPVIINRKIWYLQNRLKRL